MTKNPLKASCHCGQVKVVVEQAPEFLQDCNCSLCSNSGGVWGYFNPAQVKVSGATKGYTRSDVTDPAVEIRFCENCGATTHWVLTADYIAEIGKNEQMGVNMRLFNSDDLSGLELRFPDGKNWSGDTAYGYRRPAIILGDNYIL